MRPNSRPHRPWNGMPLREAVPEWESRRRRRLGRPRCCEPPYFEEPTPRVPASSRKSALPQ